MSLEEVENLKVRLLAANGRGAVSETSNFELTCCAIETLSLITNINTQECPLFYSSCSSMLSTNSASGAKSLFSTSLLLLLPPKEDEGTLTMKEHRRGKNEKK